MALETLDSLDKDSLKPLVLVLLARIDALLEQNRALLARIAELEARAGQAPKTPTNSSLPPSTGQKGNRPETVREKNGRKGRPGVARALCPDPDQTREIYAEACSCGAALSLDDQPCVHAYDHIDLPPMRPVTTRINLHSGNCPRCKRRVAARPPAGMQPGSPFGPGIVSVVMYLHACQMISCSRMTEVLDSLFGLKLSQGAIANMLARAAKPYAASAASIAETVRQSPVVASDETSARVCGKTHWQWTFAAASAVYHTIAPTRGKLVPTEFLGQAKPKVWISDRLAAQGQHAEAHQYCLAHLIRDAQYAIDAGDTVFAPAFKRFLQKACAIGRRRPDLADATIKAYQRRLQRQLDRLLKLKPTAAAGRHLRDAIIVDARDKLLVFLDRRDVEPTNNVSERALRPSVIFRKVTNGFRSAWGAKLYADLCSIVATGRLAGRSPLAAIRAALAPTPKAAAA
jgi:transposase